MRLWANFRGAVSVLSLNASKTKMSPFSDKAGSRPVESAAEWAQGVHDRKRKAIAVRSVYFDPQMLKTSDTQR
ncbi:MAG: hypothetical protein AB8B83_07620 [Bdellovibrionales bacterium]